MSFQLPELPYAFDALEPHIDARTMEIHHGKHHAGYTAKLNAAIEGTDNESKSIEDLCIMADTLGGAVRNNGGGYYNHCLFWEVMSPSGGGLQAEILQMLLKMTWVVLTNSKKTLIKRLQQDSVQDGPG